MNLSRSDSSQLRLIVKKIKNFSEFDDVILGTARNVTDRVTQNIESLKFDLQQNLERQGIPGITLSSGEC